MKQPEQIQHQERHRDTGEIQNGSIVLARYLFQSKHFRTSASDNQKGGARPEAFMPPPDRQLSTYSIEGIGEAEIWKIGREVLATGPRTTLYGRADLPVNVVQSNGLLAVRDDDPPRHVNIVGWPDPKEEKSKVKSIAQELAASAVLRVLNPPITKDQPNR